MRRVRTSWEGRLALSRALAGVDFFTLLLLLLLLLWLVVLLLWRLSGLEASEPDEACEVDRKKVMTHVMGAQCSLRRESVWRTSRCPRGGSGTAGGDIIHGGLGPGAPSKGCCHRDCCSPVLPKSKVFQST